MDCCRSFTHYRLILVVGLGVLKGVKGDSAALWKIPVYETTLSDATCMENSSVDSLLKCSMKMARNTEAEFFCYKDQWCQVYNRTLLPIYTHDSQDPIAQYCYTKVNGDCMTSAGSIKEGATEISPPDCIKKICIRTDLINRYGPIENCANPLFEHLPGVGCIYLAQDNKDVTEAETECASYGAQLIAPENFQILQEHLTCTGSTVKYWTTVVDGKWPDGRDVSISSHWPNELNTGCGLTYFSVSAGTYYIKTKSCAHRHPYICQLI